MTEDSAEISFVSLKKQSYAQHIQGSVLPEKEQEKKKKVQTPEKLQKELERLNLLFQKGRIEWDYYSKEYDRIENELNELLNTAPELEPDYAYLEELLNTDFRTMYYNLTQENRRAFWLSIIREIHLNTDHTVDSVDFL